jgi:hypothetical protein
MGSAFLFFVLWTVDVVWNSHEVLKQICAYHCIKLDLRDSSEGIVNPNSAFFLHLHCTSRISLQREKLNAPTMNWTLIIGQAACHLMEPDHFTWRYISEESYTIVLPSTQLFYLKITLHVSTTKDRYSLSMQSKLPQNRQYAPTIDNQHYKEPSEYVKIRQNHRRFKRSTMNT